MKNKFLLLAALLLISPFVLKAQVATLSEKEVLSLLCQKWQVSQITSGPRKMNVKPGSDYMLFNSDFTREKKEDGKITKAKWSYSHSGKKITFDDSDEYRIKEISSSELQLSGNWGGDAIVLTLRRVVQ